MNPKCRTDALKDKSFEENPEVVVVVVVANITWMAENRLRRNSVTMNCNGMVETVLEGTRRQL